MQLSLGSEASGMSYLQELEETQSPEEAQVLLIVGELALSPQNR